jgi:hypothetical protein
MRLRILLVILGLVVVPGVVFALAKSHARDSNAARSSWTAYPTTGQRSANDTSTAATTADTTGERAEIRAEVARWKADHPGGTCSISYPDTAQCQTAAGLAAGLGVIIMASSDPSPTP